MAANKFATMLHKNCHKIVVILVYTLLEWILILFLLLNSSFSYLIQKFANYFGLRQSCTWCSRLDHIFDSKKTANFQFDHVCEAHGAEISKLSYCTNHKRLAESKNLCTGCSSSNYGTINDVSCTTAFFTWMNGEEKQCCCCDEILSRKVYPPSWDVVDYVHKKALSDQRGLDKECELQSDAGEKREEFECDDPFMNRSNEDDESVFLTDMLLQNADYTDSDRFICIELIDRSSVSSQKPLTNPSDNASTEDERGGDDGEAAGIEEAQDFPDEAKDEGRGWSAEEELKAVYKELEEERRAAEEGAKETMAMITKLQQEKEAMQMEALQYQRMMEEQAEYDQEALQLLNDLMTKRDREKKELEKELQSYRNKAFDYEENECENEYDDSHNLDDSLGENVSLAEFDEERLSILDEVKILEAKLFGMHDDETKLSRNGNEVMAKKLLPLFDAVENGNEFEEYDNRSSGRMSIEGELGHVYERLQALEQDNDFLKHCIRSMTKGGNEGMILVQEILQHLRELKCVQLSATTNMAHIASSDASNIKEDEV